MENKCNEERNQNKILDNKIQASTKEFEDEKSKKKNK